MQKSPILPTTPFQGGDPVFSTPTVEAAAAVQAAVVPYRMLMGVGLLLPILFAPLLVIL